MFEKPFSALLAQHLKQFIQNVNEEQLRVSLWSGDVVLRDVELRHDILDQISLLIFQSSEKDDDEEDEGDASTPSSSRKGGRNGRDHGDADDDASEAAAQALLLPFTVIKGVVKELIITVPWSALDKEPVSIELRGVQLVLGPLRARPFDAQEEEQRVNIIKDKQLDWFEQQRLQRATTTTTTTSPDAGKNAAASLQNAKWMTEGGETQNVERQRQQFAFMNSGKGDSWKTESAPSGVEHPSSPPPVGSGASQLGNLSYMNKLIETITRNAHIILRDVSIEYLFDYAGLHPSLSSSLSVQMDEIYLSTTDEDWQDRFVMDLSMPHRKVVSVEGFRVVLKSQKSTPVGSDAATPDSSWLYELTIIDKFDFNVRLQLPNKFSPRGANLVGIHGIVTDTLSVNVSLESISVARRLVESLQHGLLCSKYRQFLHLLASNSNASSPAAAPAGRRNARAWSRWRYAVACVQADIRKAKNVGKGRRQRIDVVSFGHMRRDYVALFKRSQGVAWLPPLSDQESHRLREIETMLNLEQIVFIRCLAYAELGFEQSATAHQRELIRVAQSNAQQNLALSRRGGLLNWFGRWRGRESDAAESSSAPSQLVPPAPSTATLSSSEPDSRAVPSKNTEKSAPSPATLAVARRPRPQPSDDLSGGAAADNANADKDRKNSANLSIYEFFATEWNAGARYLHGGNVKSLAQKAARRTQNNCILFVLDIPTTRLNVIPYQRSCPAIAAFPASVGQTLAIEIQTFHSAFDSKPQAENTSLYVTAAGANVSFRGPWETPLLSTKNSLDSERGGDANATQQQRNVAPVKNSAPKQQWLTFVVDATGSRAKLTLVGTTITLTPTQELQWWSSALMHAVATERAAAMLAPTAMYAPPPVPQPTPAPQSQNKAGQAAPVPAPAPFVPPSTPQQQQQQQQQPQRSSQTQINRLGLSNIAAAPDTVSPSPSHMFITMIIRETEVVVPYLVSEESRSAERGSYSEALTLVVPILRLHTVDDLSKRSRNPLPEYRISIGGDKTPVQILHTSQSVPGDGPAQIFSCSKIDILKNAEELCISFSSAVSMCIDPIVLAFVNEAFFRDPLEVCDRDPSLAALIEAILKKHTATSDLSARQQASHRVKWRMDSTTSQIFIEEGSGRLHSQLPQPVKVPSGFLRRYICALYAATEMSHRASLADVAAHAAKLSAVTSARLAAQNPVQLDVTSTHEAQPTDQHSNCDLLLSGDTNFSDGGGCNDQTEFNDNPESNTLYSAGAGNANTTQGFTEAHLPHGLSSNSLLHLLGMNAETAAAAAGLAALAAEGGGTAPAGNEEWNQQQKMHMDQQPLAQRLTASPVGSVGSIAMPYAEFFDAPDNQPTRITRIAISLAMTRIQLKSEDGSAFGEIEIMHNEDDDDGDILPYRPAFVVFGGAPPAMDFLYTCDPQREEVSMTLAVGDISVTTSTGLTIFAVETLRGSVNTSKRAPKSRPGRPTSPLPDGQNSTQHDTGRTSGTAGTALTGNPVCTRVMLDAANASVDLVPELSELLEIFLGTVASVTPSTTASKRKTFQAILPAPVQVDTPAPKLEVRLQLNRTEVFASRISPCLGEVVSCWEATIRNAQLRILQPGDHNKASGMDIVVMGEVESLVRAEEDLPPPGTAEDDEEICKYLVVSESSNLIGKPQPLRFRVAISTFATPQPVVAQHYTTTGEDPSQPGASLESEEVPDPRVQATASVNVNLRGGKVHIYQGFVARVASYGSDPIIVRLSNVASRESSTSGYTRFFLFSQSMVQLSQQELLELRVQEEARGGPQAGAAAGQVHVSAAPAIDATGREKPTYVTLFDVKYDYVEVFLAADAYEEVHAESPETYFFLSARNITVSNALIVNPTSGQWNMETSIVVNSLSTRSDGVDSVLQKIAHRATIRVLNDVLLIPNEAGDGYNRLFGAGTSNQTVLITVDSDPKNPPTYAAVDVILPVPRLSAIISFVARNCMDPPEVTRPLPLEWQRYVPNSTPRVSSTVILVSIPSARIAVVSDEQRIFSLRLNGGFQLYRAADGQWESNPVQNMMFRGVTLDEILSHTTISGSTVDPTDDSIANFVSHAWANAADSHAAEARRNSRGENIGSRRLVSIGTIGVTSLSGADPHGQHDGGVAMTHCRVENVSILAMAEPYVAMFNFAKIRSIKDSMAVMARQQESVSSEVRARDIASTRTFVQLCNVAAVVNEGFEKRLCELRIPSVKISQLSQVHGKQTVDVAVDEAFQLLHFLNDSTNGTELLTWSIPTGPAADVDNPDGPQQNIYLRVKVDKTSTPAHDSPSKANSRGASEKRPPEYAFEKVYTRKPEMMLASRVHVEARGATFTVEIQPLLRLVARISSEVKSLTSTAETAALLEQVSESSFAPEMEISELCVDAHDLHCIIPFTDTTNVRSKSNWTFNVGSAAVRTSVTTVPLSRVAQANTSSLGPAAGPGMNLHCFATITSVSVKDVTLVTDDLYPLRIPDMTIRDQKPMVLTTFMEKTLRTTVSKADEALCVSEYVFLSPTVVRSLVEFKRYVRIETREHMKFCVSSAHVRKLILAAQESSRSTSTACSGVRSRHGTPTTPVSAPYREELIVAIILPKITVGLSRYSDRGHATAAHPCVTELRVLDSTLITYVQPPSDLTFTDAPCAEDDDGSRGEREGANAPPPPRGKPRVTRVAIDGAFEVVDSHGSVVLFRNRGGATAIVRRNSDGREQFASSSAPEALSSPVAAGSTSSGGQDRPGSPNPQQQQQQQQHCDVGILFQIEEWEDERKMTITTNGIAATLRSNTVNYALTMQSFIQNTVLKDLSDLLDEKKPADGNTENVGRVGEISNPRQKDNLIISAHHFFVVVDELGLLEVRNVVVLLDMLPKQGSQQQQQQQRLDLDGSSGGYEVVDEGEMSTSSQRSRGSTTAATKDGQRAMLPPYKFEIGEVRLCKQGNLDLAYLSVSTVIVSLGVGIVHVAIKKLQLRNYDTFFFLDLADRVQALQQYVAQNARLPKEKEQGFKQSVVVSITDVRVSLIRQLTALTVAAAASAPRVEVTFPAVVVKQVATTTTQAFSIETENGSVRYVRPRSVSHLPPLVHNLSFSVHVSQQIVTRSQSIVVQIGKIVCVVPIGQVLQDCVEAVAHAIIPIVRDAGREASAPSSDAMSSQITSSSSSSATRVSDSFVSQTIAVHMKLLSVHVCDEAGDDDDGGERWVRMMEVAVTGQYRRGGSTRGSSCSCSSGSDESREHADTKQPSTGGEKKKKKAIAPGVLFGIDVHQVSLEVRRNGTERVTQFHVIAIDSVVNENIQTGFVTCLAGKEEDGNVDPLERAAILLRLESRTSASTPTPPAPTTASPEAASNATGSVQRGEQDVELPARSMTYFGRLKPLQITVSPVLLGMVNENILAHIAVGVSHTRARTAQASATRSWRNSSMSCSSTAEHGERAIAVASDYYIKSDLVLGGARNGLKMLFVKQPLEDSPQNVITVKGVNHARLFVSMITRPDGSLEYPIVVDDGLTVVFEGVRFVFAEETSLSHYASLGKRSLLSIRGPTAIQSAQQFGSNPASQSGPTATPSLFDASQPRQVAQNVIAPFTKQRYYMFRVNIDFVADVELRVWSRHQSIAVSAETLARYKLEKKCYEGRESVKEFLDEAGTVALSNLSIMCDSGSITTTPTGLVVNVDHTKNKEDPTRAGVTAVHAIIPQTKLTISVGHLKLLYDIMQELKRGSAHLESIPAEQEDELPLDESVTVASPVSMASRTSQILSPDASITAELRSAPALADTVESIVERSGKVNSVPSVIVRPPAIAPPQAAAHSPDSDSSPSIEFGLTAPVIELFVTNDFYKPEFSVAVSTVSLQASGHRDLSAISLTACLTLNISDYPINKPFRSLVTVTPELAVEFAQYPRGGMSLQGAVACSDVVVTIPLITALRAMRYSFAHQRTGSYAFKNSTGISLMLAAVTSTTAQRALADRSAGRSTGDGMEGSRSKLMQGSRADANGSAAGSTETATRDTAICVVASGKTVKPEIFQYNQTKFRLIAGTEEIVAQMPHDSVMEMGTGVDLATLQAGATSRFGLGTVSSGALDIVMRLNEVERVVDITTSVSITNALAHHSVSLPAGLLKPFAVKPGDTKWVTLPVLQNPFCLGVDSEWHTDTTNTLVTLESIVAAFTLASMFLEAEEKSQTRGGQVKRKESVNGEKGTKAGEKRSSTAESLDDPDNDGSPWRTQKKKEKWFSFLGARQSAASAWESSGLAGMADASPVLRHAQLRRNTLEIPLTLTLDCMDSQPHENANAANPTESMSVVMRISKKVAREQHSRNQKLCPKFEISITISPVLKIINRTGVAMSLRVSREKLGENSTSSTNPSDSAAQGVNNSVMGARARSAPQRHSDVLQSGEEYGWMTHRGDASDGPFLDVTVDVGSGGLLSTAYPLDLAFTSRTTLIPLFDQYGSGAFFIVDRQDWNIYAVRSVAVFTNRLDVPLEIFSDTGILIAGQRLNGSGIQPQTSLPVGLPILPSQMSAIAELSRSRDRDADISALLSSASSSMRGDQTSLIRVRVAKTGVTMSQQFACNTPTVSTMLHSTLADEIYIFKAFSEARDDAGLSNAPLVRNAPPVIVIAPMWSIVNNHPMLALHVWCVGLNDAPLVVEPQSSCSLTRFHTSSAADPLIQVRFGPEGLFQRSASIPLVSLSSSNVAATMKHAFTLGKDRVVPPSFDVSGIIPFTNAKMNENALMSLHHQRGSTTTEDANSSGTRDPRAGGIGRNAALDIVQFACLAVIPSRTTTGFQVTLDLDEGAVPVVIENRTVKLLHFQQATATTTGNAYAVPPHSDCAVCWESFVQEEMKLNMTFIDQNKRSVSCTVDLLKATAMKSAVEVSERIFVLCTYDVVNKRHYISITEDRALESTFLVQSRLVVHLECFIHNLSVYVASLCVPAHETSLRNSPLGFLVANAEVSIAGLTAKDEAEEDIIATLADREMDIILVRSTGLYLAASSNGKHIFGRFDVGKLVVVDCTVPAPRYPIVLSLGTSKKDPPPPTSTTAAVPGNVAPSFSVQFHMLTPQRSGNVHESVPITVVKPGEHLTRTQRPLVRHTSSHAHANEPPVVIFPIESLRVDIAPIVVKMSDMFLYSLRLAWECASETAERSNPKSSSRRPHPASQSAAPGNQASTRSGGVGEKNAPSSQLPSEPIYNCYIARLFVSRIEFELTLTRRSDGRYNPFQGIPIGGRMIPSVERVPLIIREITRADIHQRCRTPADALVSVLWPSYRTQLAFQFYKVIGSLEALGNPVMLVAGLSKGIRSFVVETAALNPIQGARMLLSSTTSSALHSFGLLSRAGSRTAAAIGFDQRWLEDRENRTAERSGILWGVTSGFAEGLEGVVAQPYRGAQQRGVTGFFTGVASGAVGLVTRPVAGILEALGHTAEYYSGVLAGTGEIPNAHNEYLASLRNFSDSVGGGVDGQQNTQTLSTRSVDNPFSSSTVTADSSDSTRSGLQAKNSLSPSARITKERILSDHQFVSYTYFKQIHKRIEKEDLSGKDAARFIISEIGTQNFAMYVDWDSFVMFTTSEEFFNWVHIALERELAVQLLASLVPQLSLHQRGAGPIPMNTSLERARNIKHTLGVRDLLKYVTVDECTQTCTLTELKNALHPTELKGVVGQALLHNTVIRLDALLKLPELQRHPGSK